MSPIARVREAARMVSAFVRLDAAEDRSYPLHIILLATAQVAPVVVYFFVAKLVGASAGDSVGGDYYTFATVGILVSAALDGVLRTVGLRLQLLQNRGTLEGLLVEPAPWTMLPLAMSGWTAVLTLISGAGGLAMASALGADFRLAAIPAFIGVIALAMVAAGAVGTVSGAVLVLTKRSDPVMRVYSLVSALVAGAVFPVELLPGPLRAVSVLVPHRHAIDAARQVLMANPPADGDAASSILALAAFGAIVLPLGMLLFARSLARARASGLLWTY